MNVNSIGDLSINMLIQDQIGQLKSSLNDRVSEVTSGEVKDKVDHLGSSISLLSSLDRDSTRIAAELNVIGMATSTFRVQSDVLARVASLSAETSNDFLFSASGENEQHVKAASAGAFTKLGSLIAALNTQVSGKSIFSGASTDTQPLVSAEEFIDELTNSISPISDLSSFVTQVDNFFLPGGGFETLVYQGATEELGQHVVGHNQYVGTTVSANDDEFLRLMKSFGLAVLIENGTVDFSATQMTELSELIGNELKSGSDQVVSFQADIGASLKFLESKQVELQASEYSMSSLRNALVGIDPAQAIVELTEAENSLALIFQITGRLSNLSLARYLN